MEERDGAYYYNGEKVSRLLGKMGKSLKNAVTPDEICSEYGADTLRLYEMAMGPLDVSRPWDTRAVVGQYRLLQRLWRNVVDENTGEVTVVDAEPDEATLRALHKAIDGVGQDMANLRFNTAIAKVTELNNFVTKLSEVPRSVAERMVLLIAALAPHIAEELWRKLGHETSVVHAGFPRRRPRLPGRRVRDLRRPDQGQGQGAPGGAPLDLRGGAGEDRAGRPGGRRRPGRRGHPQGDRAGAEAGQHRSGVMAGSPH
ncbi:hypothetical protein GCM10020000_55070 [Streptomyces olivoverticillatus]